MNITLDDGRTELWQWDTGRKIVVDDKSVSEVHYSKYSSTQAITREVVNGKAEIPNFLLQDTHAVTAYAYSGSIENGYTMAEKTFNVVKKPKPANYVETEEDKAILAKLKAAIGDLSELQTEAKNNLVSAINEAAASGGSTDAVLYTAQTLTNAQKKQARQNIDVDVNYFVVNGTMNSNFKPTLDKTFSQIREAISDGKIPIVAIGGAYYQLSQNTDEFITFLAAVADNNVSGFQTIYVYPSNGTQIYFHTLLSTDSFGALPQVNMSSDPTEAMQIATKKYVDDIIESGVEISVQSDWNQNDATAADYVKNRPGGYIGEVIVYSGTLPSDFGIIEQSFEIVEGKKYYVSTNDGEYIEYTAIKEEFSDGMIYYSFGSMTVSEFMESSSAIYGKFLFASTIVDGRTMFGGASGESTGTTYKVRAVDIVKIPQKYLDLNIDTKAAITVFASETDDDALYYYVQNYGSVIFYDDQGYNEKPTQLYDFDKYTVFGASAPYSYSIRKFMVCQNLLRPVIKILEYDSTNDTKKWKFTDIVYPSILMRSSTLGSKKQFEITVDDSGTISATEVTT